MAKNNAPGGHTVSGPIQINPIGINLGNAMQFAMRERAIAAKGAKSPSLDLIKSLLTKSPMVNFDGTNKMSGEMGVAYAEASMRLDNAKHGIISSFVSGDKDQLSTYKSEYDKADMDMRMIQSRAPAVKEFGANVNKFGGSIENGNDILFIEGQPQWNPKTERFATLNDYHQYMNTLSVEQMPQQFIEPDEVNNSLSNNLHTKLKEVKGDVAQNVNFTKTTAYGNQNDVQLIGNNTFVRDKSITTQYKIEGIPEAYARFRESLKTPEIGKEFNASMFKAINDGIVIAKRDDQLNGEIDPKEPKYFKSYNMKENFMEFKKLQSEGKHDEANAKYNEITDQYAKYLTNGVLDKIPQYHQVRDGLLGQIDENLTPVLKGVWNKATGLATNAIISRNSLNSLASGDVTLDGARTSAIAKNLNDVDGMITFDVTDIFNMYVDPSLKKQYNETIDANKAHYNHPTMGKYYQASLKYGIIQDQLRDPNSKLSGVMQANDRVRDRVDGFANRMGRIDEAVSVLSGNMSQEDKDKYFATITDMSNDEIQVVNKQYVDHEKVYELSPEEEKKAFENKTRLGVNDEVYIGGTRQVLDKQYPIIGFETLSSGVLYTDNDNEIMYNGATVGAKMMVDAEGLAKLGVEQQYYDKKSNKIKIKRFALGENGYADDSRTKVGEGYGVVHYEDYNVIEDYANRFLGGANDQTLAKAEQILTEDFQMEVSTDSEYFVVTVQVPVNSVYTWEGKALEFGQWSSQNTETGTTFPSGGKDASEFLIKEVK